MNPAVEQIARAVLYEGYLLYPYRESALKNRQRWNFGVLYPAAWAARQTGSDRSYLHMEILPVAGPDCRVSISLRFLHLASIENSGRAWEEAEEKQVDVQELPLGELAETKHVSRFYFGGLDRENAGARWRRMAVAGEIEISAAPVSGRALRLAVRVTNTTRGAAANRDDALLLSLASAHVVVTTRNGELISLTDPPDGLRDAAAACQNTGVWPVLVGEPGSGETMLGSPIILYDYPQIAPESRGDLFDGTEIDEILTLRILTLTDEEKAELRKSDERARRMLDRIEAAPEDHLLELHGAIRGRRDLYASPARAEVVNGTELKKGDRVRLRPARRADVFDTLLAGKIAIIEAVEQDFEGRVHFAVVLEDDPGRDLGYMRQAGHRFFYGRDEVEPVVNEAGQ